MSPKILIGLKGFAMGLADIVPGVSGGTVAFITGIYDELLSSISKVNKDFLKLVFGLQLKEALAHINFPFLAPLLGGILAAILIASRLMHYLMLEWPVLTWSLFFGLICASCIYIGKHIKRPSSPIIYGFLPLGIAIGVGIVSLVPVSTPNSYFYIFASGAIAICAMILPGISGSFILLILGKYAYVTGALKSPFVGENLLIIIMFAVGCLVGLLSFARLLNYLMHKKTNIMMLLLTGFMAGSLKKIWPWKKTLETVVVRGKEHVLREANIMPRAFDAETIFAIALMIGGFLAVLGLEYMASRFQPKTES